MQLNAESITDTVNAWFSDRIAIGAVARNTEAYNQAYAARADLIGRLSALLPPQSEERGGASEEVPHLQEPE